MGSNQNKHGDRKAAREWGSKARKEEAHTKSRTFEQRAIEDSVRSNVEPPDEPEDWCGPDCDGIECQLLPPKPKGKRRKKNTKRWCRGKAGQEHDFQLFDKWPGIRILGSFIIHRCTRCGKEIYTWKR